MHGDTHMSHGQIFWHQSLGFVVFIGDPMRFVCPSLGYQTQMVERHGVPYQMAHGGVITLSDDSMLAEYSLTDTGKE